jgi:predicted DNA-binding transcriptional regulator AlpA
MEDVAFPCPYCGKPIDFRERNPIILESELVRLLKIHPSTLYNWTKKKGFPEAVKQRRRPRVVLRKRYRREEVLQWLRQSGQEEMAALIDQVVP